MVAVKMPGSRRGLGGGVYIDGMNYDMAEPLITKTTFCGNVSHHGSAVLLLHKTNLG